VPAVPQRRRAQRRGASESLDAPEHGFPHGSGTPTGAASVPLPSVRAGLVPGGQPAVRELPLDLAAHVVLHGERRGVRGGGSAHDPLPREPRAAPRPSPPGRAVPAAGAGAAAPRPAGLPTTAALGSSWQPAERGWTLAAEQPARPRRSRGAGAHELPP